MGVDARLGVVLRASRGVGECLRHLVCLSRVDWGPLGDCFGMRRKVQTVQSRSGPARGHEQEQELDQEQAQELEI